MNKSTTHSRRDDRSRRLSSRLSGEAFTIDAEDEPRLGDYREILWDHKRLIVGVVAFTLLLSLLYVVFATPIYRANLLIQIEDSAPESKSFLTGTTGLGDLKTTATGELQVLGSRMVLGAAVDQTKLQISARPRYLPLVGAWSARRSEELSDPGFLGLGILSGYVTGSERIVVDRFDVPSAFEDTEDPFVITAQGDGRFTVSHELLTGTLEGVVGTPIRQSLPEGAFDIRITDLDGKPGAQFVVAVASRFRAIERLQDRLLMAEQGRLSNVVSVALEDSDRIRLGLVLNAIADQYVRQNRERKSAEADKTLEFLNAQLPIFEKQLRTSEDVFARFRNENATVAFDEEAKVWLKSTAELQTNLLQLQQRRLDLERTHIDAHPMVKTLNQQIVAVQGQLSALNKKIVGMPNMQRDALRLERDVHANTAQFQSMQNNALQMRLLREGKIGNVRLLDRAVVSKVPVKPQKALIVAFALVLGGLIGPALAIYSTRSKRGIQNPGEVAAHTGLELFAVIPQSAEQKLLDIKQDKKKSGDVLADLYPHSHSIEAMRGLRVGLKIAMEEADDNRILITGATPGIGKSFIASNLAMLLAQTERRVLLISADMRKGGETCEFGLRREGGLTELFSGEISAEQAIHVDVRPNLDVLTTGKLPRFPTDMLESKAFTSMLDRLSKQYDHLVIDAAPVLVAADAVAVAPSCGVVLLVARAEISELEELNESIRRLAQAGASVDGLLLNGIGVGRRYKGSYGYAHGSHVDAGRAQPVPAG